MNRIAETLFCTLAVKVATYQTNAYSEENCEVKNDCLKVKTKNVPEGNPIKVNWF